MPGTDATLSFGVSGTLTLVPGEVQSVVVMVDPPAHYEVSFHLVGAALDASLSPATMVTDAGGLGAVTLRAPNAATSFVLRATLTEGPTQELQVAVSDQGFGSLEIVPLYAGQRPIEQWIAKVVSGTNCSAIAESLPEDPPGALSAEADVGDPLVLDVAPVGPNLAVVVRGGHYMWGCTDESSLVAGGTRNVQVPIVDKPIDASDTSLTLQLEFLPDLEPWAEMADATADRMMAAILGEHATESAALLDAMAIASGTPSEFVLAATEQGWLPLVQARAEISDATLERAIRELGVGALESEPLSVKGTLAAVPDVGGYALLTVEQLLGISPHEGGAPTEYLVNLSVDSADVVQLGGRLFWLASRVLGAAADRAAEAQETPPLPAVEDAPSWLAAQLSCSALAAELGGFAECDEACVADACTAGLQQLWQNARDASVSDGLIGQVSLQASGAAQYDDYAQLTGFAGVWLGDVTDGESQLGVTGQATGEPTVDVRPR